MRAYRDLCKNAKKKDLSLKATAVTMIHLHIRCETDAPVHSSKTPEMQNFVGNICSFGGGALFRPGSGATGVTLCTQVGRHSSSTL